MAIMGYDAFTGRDGNASPFLWWCAGAHAPTLREFPTEQNKYSTLGGVLLATFVLAALSSGYAFFTIFGNVLWAIGFAVLWGAIIFNFDRFMVATIRKYGVSAARQWRVTFPRIVLAILIGITIARPLELKLFEKEINVRVSANLNRKMASFDRQQDSLFAANTLSAQTERDRLATERKAMSDTLLRLQQSYIQEADGTGGTGRRGADRITRLKQDAYAQTAVGYADRFQRIDSLLKKHDSYLLIAGDSLNQAKMAFAQTAKESVGFLERNKALSDLSKEEDAVFWANFFVSLLIILLETAPIIAKMLLPIGPYDIALAKKELLPMGLMQQELEKAQENLRPPAGMSAV